MVISLPGSIQPAIIKCYEPTPRLLRIVTFNGGLSAIIYLCPGTLKIIAGVDGGMTIHMVMGSVSGY